MGLPPTPMTLKYAPFEFTHWMLETEIKILSIMGNDTKTNLLDMSQFLFSLPPLCWLTFAACILLCIILLGILSYSKRGSAYIAHFAWKTVEVSMGQGEFPAVGAKQILLCLGFLMGTSLLSILLNSNNSADMVSFIPPEVIDDLEALLKHPTVKPVLSNNAIAETLRQSPNTMHAKLWKKAKDYCIASMDPEGIEKIESHMENGKGALVDLLAILSVAKRKICLNDPRKRAHVSSRTLFKEFFALLLKRNIHSTIRSRVNIA